LMFTEIAMQSNVLRNFAVMTAIDSKGLARIKEYFSNLTTLTSSYAPPS